MVAHRALSPTLRGDAACHGLDHSETAQEVFGPEELLGLFLESTAVRGEPVSWSHVLQEVQCPGRHGGIPPLSNDPTALDHVLYEVLKFLKALFRGTCQPAFPQLEAGQVTQLEPVHIANVGIIQNHFRQHLIGFNEPLCSQQSTSQPIPGLSPGKDAPGLLFGLPQKAHGLIGIAPGLLLSNGRPPGCREDQAVLVSQIRLRGIEGGCQLSFPVQAKSNQQGVGEVGKGLQRALP